MVVVDSDIATIVHVHHCYGARAALDDVGVAVPARCMAGVIGPDGVGKSTLLALIAGVRTIQRGEVAVFCGNMSDAAHRHACRARIAYMPQGLGRNLYPTLSVFENIDFFGRLFGQSREEREWRIDDLLQSTDLSAFRDRPAGKLSGGMKQKLGLCCSLIHDPDLLILDEPSQGLAPLIVQEVFRVVAAARDEGISVLLVEQNVRAAVAVADRAYVLDDGRIVYSGAAAEFAKDEERVRALAGASAETWSETEPG